MEFNVKLQYLRKQKGLTQEELAEHLYVSRTAISKWESGRGYPSIDSLKAIATFFSISVDELLSTEEILTIADENNKKERNYLCDLIYGLLDLAVGLLFFLPLFAVRESSLIYNASLLELNGVQPYLKALLFIPVISSVIFGIMTLAMQNMQAERWLRSKRIISLSISVTSVLLFTLSLHPYATVFTFALLLVKILLLIKRQ